MSLKPFRRARLRDKLEGMSNDEIKGQIEKLKQETKEAKKIGKVEKPKTKKNEL